MSSQARETYTPALTRCNTKKGTGAGLRRHEKTSKIAKCWTGNRVIQVTMRPPYLTHWVVGPATLSTRTPAPSAPANALAHCLAVIPPGTWGRWLQGQTLNTALGSGHSPCARPQHISPQQSAALALWPVPLLECRYRGWQHE